MLTLIALAIVSIALIAIRASAHLVVLIITITAVVVLGTTNAHAAPGIGACGECTSHIVGLSADYFIALILAVICVVATVLVIRDDKKNK